MVGHHPVSVTENGNSRRSDIVVFANPLRLAVIELMTPDENAIVWSMFHQSRAHKAELSSLFSCNTVPDAPDGMQQRLRRLSAGREWFKPHRTIGVQVLVPACYTEVPVTSKGIFFGEFA